MAENEAPEDLEEMVGGDVGDEASDPAQQAQERYLRTLADFDNYRKRVERDRSASARAANRDLLLGLLDVVDSFERGVAAAVGSDESDPLAAGFLAIYRQLQRLLEGQGVQAFESVGEPFDPERHEAVGVVESADVTEGHVANELARGYLWNGALLRPARVQVAR
jgi:molecular chaperone GrpE